MFARGGARTRLLLLLRWPPDQRTPLPPRCRFSPLPAPPPLQPPHRRTSSHVIADTSSKGKPRPDDTPDIIRLRRSTRRDGNGAIVSSPQGPPGRTCTELARCIVLSPPLGARDCLHATILRGRPLLPCTERHNSRALWPGWSAPRHGIVGQRGHLSRFGFACGSCCLLSRIPFWPSLISRTMMSMTSGSLSFDPPAAPISSRPQLITRVRFNKTDSGTLPRSNRRFRSTRRTFRARSPLRHQVRVRMTLGFSPSVLRVPEHVRPAAPWQHVRSPLHAARRRASRVDASCPFWSRSRDYSVSLSFSLSCFLSLSLSGRGLPDAASPATNAGLILVRLQRRAVPPLQIALALALCGSLPPLFTTLRTLVISPSFLYLSFSIFPLFLSLPLSFSLSFSLPLSLSFFSLLPSLSGPTCTPVSRRAHLGLPFPLALPYSISSISIISAIRLLQPFNSLSPPLFPSCFFFSSFSLSLLFSSHIPSLPPIPFLFIQQRSATRSRSHSTLGGPHSRHHGVAWYTMRYDLPLPFPYPSFPTPPARLLAFWHPSSTRG